MSSDKWKNVGAIWNKGNGKLTISVYDVDEDGKRIEGSEVFYSASKNKFKKKENQPDYLIFVPPSDSDQDRSRRNTSSAKKVNPPQRRNNQSRSYDRDDDIGALEVD